MGFADEFKTFIAKGNVVDLAVGVIIGAAFGKIVGSLVEDVVMPVLGKFLGGVNFTNLKVVLDPAYLKDGKEVAENAIKYGNFVQMCFNFLLMAFVVFCFVKAINTMRDRLVKKAEAAPAPPPPEDPAEVRLLTEIRDLLAKR